MTRAETLERAKVCVCGERESDYGTPEDNFKRIAELWSAYTGHTYTSIDVAMMMALLKCLMVSRELLVFVNLSVEFSPLMSMEIVCIFIVLLTLSRIRFLTIV